MTRFDAVADDAGFLVVYVDSHDGTYDTRLCCKDTDRDVTFVQSVLAAVGERWPVDPKRVYAAWLSIGAAMTYKLAVRSPGTFAAVAPVSGGFFPDPAVPDPAAAVSSPPPSVITFLGGTDSSYQDFTDGVDLWRRGAGCGEPSQTSVDRTSSNSTRCRSGLSGIRARERRRPARRRPAAATRRRRRTVSRSPGRS